MRRALVIALGLLPSLAAAQGSIGALGYGYPTGGLSAAAASMGGANAEIDPNSAINPAAITRSNRLSVMFRFEPEFRSTDAGSVRANAVVPRFPAFQVTGAFGRWVGAAGVSTMLDRTWRNQYSDSLVIGGETVASNVQIGSEGAIGDARVAVGYVVSPRVQLGASMHAIVGQNRTVFNRTFDPATGVSAISQSSPFGFTGSAVSVGVVAEVLPDLVVASSARFGGDMGVELRGTEVGQGKVPTRYGLGLTYFGVRGLALFGRVDQTSWTDIGGVATDSTSVFDATDLALGAEALGPRLFGANTALRVGLRQRVLPFGLNGASVSERGATFGVSLPVSRGRGQIELGAQRMLRSVTGVEEEAWIVTVGLGIRP